MGGVVELVADLAYKPRSQLCLTCMRNKCTCQQSQSGVRGKVKLILLKVVAQSKSVVEYIVRIFEHRSHTIIRQSHVQAWEVKVRCHSCSALDATDISQYNAAFVPGKEVVVWLAVAGLKLLKLLAVLELGADGRDSGDVEQSREGSPGYHGVSAGNHNRSRKARV